MATSCYWMVTFILGCNFSVAGSYQCTSEYRPTVHICQSSYQSSSAVLFDFKTFQSINTNGCTCRIFVNRGTRLSFNYLSSPGYYGCGTRIRLTGDSTSIISCLPAAQSLEVSPGRIVMVEILRTNDAGSVNSDYCYSVEINDYVNSTSFQDGQYTVICDLPEILSTTTESTSTLPRSPTKTKTITWSQTSTTQVTPNITTVPPDSLSWLPYTTTTGVQKTPVTHNTVHLPWEIITPVSLLLLVLIVVAVVIYKMKKGKRRKTKLKMKMIAKHFHNSHRPIEEIRPRTPDVEENTTAKTGSGDYSILNENVVRTKAEIKVSEEEGVETSGEQTIEEKVVEIEHSSKEECVEEDICCEVVDDLDAGLSDEERATLCASMDMIEQFIEETTRLALSRFHRDRCSVVGSRDNPQEQDVIAAQDESQITEQKWESHDLEKVSIDNEIHEVLSPNYNPRSRENDAVKSRRSNVPFKYNVRKSIQFWEGTIQTEGNANVSSDQSTNDVTYQVTNKRSMKHSQNEDCKLKGIGDGEEDKHFSEDDSEVSQDEVLEIDSALKNEEVEAPTKHSDKIYKPDKSDSNGDNNFVIDVLALV